MGSEIQPRHGTNGWYTNHRCRCDLCRAAALVVAHAWKANHPEWKTQNKLNFKKRQTAVMAFVDQIKESNPCKDCGGFFPAYVMQFDHLPQYAKTLEIGWMRRHSKPAAILEEIKKCELVCSNCHFIRTHKRKLERIMAGKAYRSKQTYA